VTSAACTPCRPGVAENDCRISWLLSFHRALRSRYSRHAGKSPGFEPLGSEASYVCGYVFTDGTVSSPLTVPELRFRPCCRHRTWPGCRADSSVCAKRRVIRKLRGERNELAASGEPTQCAALLCKASFDAQSASWLNAVEGFFTKLHVNAYGVFRSVPELQAAILRFHRRGQSWSETLARRQRQDRRIVRGADLSTCRKLRRADVS
jgi:hypothetical protein